MLDVPLVPTVTTVVIVLLGCMIYALNHHSGWAARIVTWLGTVVFSVPILCLVLIACVWGGYLLTHGQDKADPLIVICLFPGIFATAGLIIRLSEAMGLL